MLRIFINHQVLVLDDLMHNSSNILRFSLLWMQGLVKGLRQLEVSSRGKDKDGLVYTVYASGHRPFLMCIMRMMGGEVEEVGVCTRMHGAGEVVTMDGNNQVRAITTHGEAEGVEEVRQRDDSRTGATR